MGRERKGTQMTQKKRDDHRENNLCKSVASVSSVFCLRIFGEIDSSSICPLGVNRPESIEIATSDGFTQSPRSKILTCVYLFPTLLSSKIHSSIVHFLTCSLQAFVAAIPLIL